MAEKTSNRFSSNIAESEGEDRISADDDEIISQIHYSALKHGLSALVQEDLLCDVILVTQGQRFGCHKVVLSTFSSFFKSMFTIGMKESDQEEIILDVFEVHLIKKMLDFVYNGTVLSVRDMFDLLPVAVYFQIESLQTVCELTLNKAINMDNVTNIWKASAEDFPQLIMLKQTCQNYLLQNFCVFAKTRDFLELKCKDLIFLISNRSLKVSSEEFVCKSVTQWFQHKFTERKEFLYDVFQHVHFPLLKLQFIEESFPFLNEPSLQRIMDENKLFTENLGIQADFSSLRSDWRVCSDREKVLVVLGYFENYSHSEEFWCYHYKDKTWQLLIPPSQPAVGYQTCTYKQSYLLLSVDTEFLVYDGIKNDWSSLADLDEPRKHHCMVVVRSSVFALGGLRDEDLYRGEDGETLHSVSKYASLEDANTEWVGCGSLCYPVSKAASAVANTKIYLFSGTCVENPDEVFEFVQCYDTITNESTVIECVLPIGQSFNWLQAYGYGDHIFLTNARKIWRFYGESGEQDRRYLEELHTFPRERQLSGFVTKSRSLYLLGNVVTESEAENSTLTKGIVKFDLLTNSVKTVVDKALFLPSVCHCHNLVVSKTIANNFLW